MKYLLQHICIPNICDVETNDFTYFKTHTNFKTCPAISLPIILLCSQKKKEKKSKLHNFIITPKIYLEIEQ